VLLRHVGLGFEEVRPVIPGSQKRYYLNNEAHMRSRSLVFGPVFHYRSSFIPPAMPLPSFLASCCTNFLLAYLASVRYLSLDENLLDAHTGSEVIHVGWTKGSKGSGRGPSCGGVERTGQPGRQAAGPRP